MTGKTLQEKLYESIVGKKFEGVRTKGALLDGVPGVTYIPVTINYIVRDIKEKDIFQSKEEHKEFYLEVEIINKEGQPNTTQQYKLRECFGDKEIE